MELFYESPRWGGRLILDRGSVLFCSILYECLFQYPKSLLLSYRFLITVSSEQWTFLSLAQGLSSAQAMLTQSVSSETSMHPFPHLHAFTTHVGRAQIGGPFSSSLSPALAPYPSLVEVSQTLSPVPRPERATAASCHQSTAVPTLRTRLRSPEGLPGSVTSPSSEVPAPPLLRAHSEPPQLAAFWFARVPRWY